MVGYNRSDTREDCASLCCIGGVWGGVGNKEVSSPTPDFWMLE